MTKQQKWDRQSARFTAKQAKKLIEIGDAEGAGYLAMSAAQYAFYAHPELREVA